MTATEQDAPVQGTIEWLEALSEVNPNTMGRRQDDELDQMRARLALLADTPLTTDEQAVRLLAVKALIADARAFQTDLERDLGQQARLAPGRHLVVDGVGVLRPRMSGGRKTLASDGAVDEFRAAVTDAVRNAPPTRAEVTDDGELAVDDVGLVLAWMWRLLGFESNRVGVSAVEKLQSGELKRLGVDRASFVEQQGGDWTVEVVR